MNCARCEKYYLTHCECVKPTASDSGEPKPPADSKPREWTLVVRGDPRNSSTWYWEVLGPCASEYHDDTHVIDHDAYAQLERERDELRKSLDWHVTGEKKMQRECERKALAYREERDKYRATLERIVKADYLALQKERDDWANRYRLIELANAELSRNDHKTFGELLIERDKYRAALEQINSHLNNPATSQNEALCLIRRDTENAREALKSQDLPPFTVAGNPSDSDCATTREE